MPIYEYTCTKCQAQFEELVFKDIQRVDCPECGSAKTRKLMSACRTRFGGGSDSADMSGGSGSSGGSKCAGCSGGSCSTC